MWLLRTSGWFEDPWYFGFAIALIWSLSRSLFRIFYFCACIPVGFAIFSGRGHEMVFMV